jgi:hypothetical protein
MEYTYTVRTTADADHAWSALAAVTTYPQWTASMTTVTALDGEQLRPDRRYRIRQPGFPPVVWRVTDLVDGEAYQWEAHSPGLHTVAYHRLAPDASGGTTITIGIRQTGALASLLGALTGSRTRRYLALEAAGLKAAAESAQRGREGEN